MSRKEVRRLEVIRQVLGARFFEQETPQGYLEVLQALVQRLGAPLALYSDRQAIVHQGRS